MSQRVALGNTVICLRCGETRLEHATPQEERDASGAKCRKS